MAAVTEYRKAIFDRLAAYRDEKGSSRRFAKVRAAATSSNLPITASNDHARDSI